MDEFPGRRIFWLIGLSLQGFLLIASLPAAAADMVDIPEGPFTAGPVTNDSPQQLIHLGSFRIDRFEVTNAEFAKQFPDHAYPPGAGAHPVSRVTWAEAKRYCEATGKRLPTETEWEKAARGGDARVYPWGNKPHKRRPHPSYSGVVKRKGGTYKKDVSPYGVRDMAGSLWEWTEQDDGENKIARGGLWNLHLDFESSKTWEKIRIAPNKRFSFLGFRCAR